MQKKKPRSRRYYLLYFPNGEKLEQSAKEVWHQQMANWDSLQCNLYEEVARHFFFTNLSVNYILLKFCQCVTPVQFALFYRVVVN